MAYTYKLSKTKKLIDIPKMPESKVMGNDIKLSKIGVSGNMEKKKKNYG